MAIEIEKLTPKAQEQWKEIQELLNNEQDKIKFVQGIRFTSTPIETERSQFSQQSSQSSEHFSKLSNSSNSVINSIQKRPNARLAMHNITQQAIPIILPPLTHALVVGTKKPLYPFSQKHLTKQTNGFNR